MPKKLLSSYLKSNVDNYINLEGNKLEQEKILKNIIKLIDNGADKNIMNKKFLLSLSKNTGHISRFLKNGIFIFDDMVNYKNNQGDTPIMILMKNSTVNLSELDYLMRIDRKISKNKEGNNILMFAVKSKSSLKLIEFILRVFSVLDYTRNDNFYFITTLFETQNNEGNTVFMIAAQKNPKAIPILLKYLKYKITRKDDEDEVLDEEFKVNKYYKLIRTFEIENIVNLNLKNKDGQTALMIAEINKVPLKIIDEFPVCINIDKQKTLFNNYLKTEMDELSKIISNFHQIDHCLEKMIMYKIKVIDKNRLNLKNLKLMFYAAIEKVLQLNIYDFWVTKSKKSFEEFKLMIRDFKNIPNFCETSITQNTQYTYDSDSDSDDSYVGDEEGFSIPNKEDVYKHLRRKNIKNIKFGNLINQNDKTKIMSITFTKNNKKADAIIKASWVILKNEEIPNYIDIFTDEVEYSYLLDKKGIGPKIYDAFFTNRKYYDDYDEDGGNIIIQYMIMEHYKYSGSDFLLNEKSI